jgi:hypothetical protein
MPVDGRWDFILCLKGQIFLILRVAAAGYLKTVTSTVGLLAVLLLVREVLGLNFCTETSYSQT